MRHSGESAQTRHKRCAGAVGRPPACGRSGIVAAAAAGQRVATIVAQGEHGRRRAGTGDSFWQYRRYQPGDPAQSIDWRQSAKTQLAYVRENEWEAAQNIYLWADRSASMNWHSDPELPTKAERAAVITLAIASLLIRGGERISRLGTGQRPARGRAVLSRMAAELTLEGVTGTGAGLRAAGEQRSYRPGLRPR